MGLNSSAAAAAASVPPVTSTRPSGKVVARWSRRACAMLPAGRQPGAARPAPAGTRLAVRTITDQRTRRFATPTMGASYRSPSVDVDGWWPAAAAGATLGVARAGGPAWTLGGRRDDDGGCRVEHAAGCARGGCGSCQGRPVAGGRPRAGAGAGHRSVRPAGAGDWGDRGAGLRRRGRGAARQGFSAVLGCSARGWWWGRWSRRGPAWGWALRARSGRAVGAPGRPPPRPRSRAFRPPLPRGGAGPCWSSPMPRMETPPTSCAARWRSPGPGSCGRGQEWPTAASRPAAPSSRWDGCTPTAWWWWPSTRRRAWRPG